MPRYIVRHGAMRSLSVLSTKGNTVYRRGTCVIARTGRGLEAGEVLCEATAEAVERIESSGHGQILRAMTIEDENERAHIRNQSRGEFEACQRHVDQLKLAMKLVDIERVFGGERVVIYYLAEQRVDFRDLVKGLASEFQTRIEMRQIGVRDEAKLLADYGDCGKPVCCNTHLSKMPPVSMRMAKLQKATLDPTKISGRCGRLKCCLRYEFDTYTEIVKELPSIGSNIETEHGNARVIGHEILARQLLIQADDKRRMLIDLTEVKRVLPRKKPQKQQAKSEEGRREKGGQEPDTKNERSTKE